MQSVDANPPVTLPATWVIAPDPIDSASDSLMGVSIPTRIDP